MGVGDAVIAAAENTVAEDAAGTQRDLPPLLLVDDVLPDSLAGGPARFVFRVDDGEDAVPLVALADFIAEKAERHGHGHGRRRDGPDDIFPAQASGEHHAAGDDAVDDGRAVVTLDVDDEDGDQHVQQQLAQLLGLVDLTTDIVQVHGKGQDKADLCQLGGLEGKAAQLVPGVVVGVACIVANGQRADGHIADEQGGEHHAPGDGNVDWPHLDEAPVIDV